MGSPCTSDTEQQARDPLGWAPGGLWLCLNQIKSYSAHCSSGKGSPSLMLQASMLLLLQDSTVKLERFC